MTRTIQRAADQAPAGDDPRSWKGSIGVALGRDALAWIECELDTIHESGESSLIVGRAVDGGSVDDRTPAVGLGRFAYPFHLPSP